MENRGSDEPAPSIPTSLKASNSPVALNGEAENADLYTLRPDGTLLIAVPIETEDKGVLGALVMLIPFPSFNPGTLSPLFRFILLSLIPFTLAAGLIGTVFGFLTARGLSRRLGRLSQAADAWSQGDFSAVAQDNAGDELSQLSQRLNLMAEQLHNLLDTSLSQSTTTAVVLKSPMERAVAWAYRACTSGWQP